MAKNDNLKREEQSGDSYDIPGIDPKYVTPEIRDIYERGNKRWIEENKKIKNFLLGDNNKNTVEEIMSRSLKIATLGVILECLVDKFRASNQPEEFVRETLAEVVNRLFPPGPSLPENPPVYWSKEHAENYGDPAKFTEIIYKDWFSTELSWPYIRNKDANLYHALRYHLKKEKINWEDYLPTKAALVKRDLERAGPEGLKEAARLVKAASRTP